MTQTLATAALVIATVLAGISLIPQIVKLVRSRDPAGVSATWPSIGVVSNGAWSAYLVHEGLWPASISTNLMIVFFGVVLWALHRAGTPISVSIWRGLAWMLVLAMITATAGWFALGTVLGFSLLLQVGPALITAYRTDLPSGISTATWYIAGTEGVMWGYYGWFYGDIPIMILAATLVGASVLMLARYRTVVRPRKLAEQPS